MTKGYKQKVFQSCNFNLSLFEHKIIVTHHGVKIIMSKRSGDSNVSLL